MSNQLDKKMQEEIDNYGSRIITMTDFISSVRQATGMYIGFIDERGYLNMIREIFQNSVDQLIETKTPCNHISVYFNEITKVTIVEDNGLGLPFDDMMRILMSQHTSKNYKKILFQYSSGLNGVGLKIVNALSGTLTVESYNYKGEARKIDTVEGYPTTKQPVSIPNPNKKQGTRVTFVPSIEVFKNNLNLDYTKVYKLIKRILSLTPIGSVVDFEGIDYRGVSHKETIINQDGIITDLIMHMKKPIIKPIVISNDTGEQKIDAAFCWDSEGEIEGAGPDSMESVTAFCNFCPTTGGTHIDGLTKGVFQWFSNYMNNIYLINQKSKNKLKVTSNDIRCGLNIMISAASLEPVFTGQAKEFLSNSEMEPYAKSMTITSLDEWSKSNPQDLAKIAKYFKDLAEIRQKSDNEKVKMVNNYNSNPTTGLPDKYAKPLGKEHLELFIVEGDSAGGSAKNARHEYTQGVYPIRGKIINAFDTPFKKFWENLEVRGITKILFGIDYYKKGLTAADCKYEKIIFLADSDIDGNHISSLLLRFFLLYFPFLIEAGMVYRGVPPLFGSTVGKKTTYYTDRLDMARIIQKDFIKKYNVTEIDNNPVSNKDISALFARNIDYVYEIKTIADRYAIEPLLLELILVNHINSKSSKSLQKEIQSKYKFLTIEEKKGGTKYISGPIGNKVQTIYFNDKLIEDCIHIINIIKTNDHVYYKLNGVECSLYEIMKIFDDLSPSNIERYKGLGEMDDHQLADSSMLPDNRTLIRFTIDDVKDTIAAVRVYESDKKLLLAMIDKVSRSELLG